MLLKRWQLLKEVMADNSLNPSALRVMYFLLNRENSTTKALFPSHMRLSADTNLCERSVRRGIDNLIEQNYVIKLKKGSPGRATTYQINYKQRTVLSKTQDSIVKNIRTDIADQSTKESINKSSVENLISRVAKNTNANYKAVVNGISQKYSSDERTYQRILKKTGNNELAEEWLRLKQSKNWNDKVRAEKIAKHLQCL
jgi:DNA-binding MarR family transcriptional regulator